MQFWNAWPKVYQYIFWIVAGAFILSLAFLWYSYFISPAPALTWQYIQEQELKEIPIHQFQLGPFDLTIQADNYLIFERLLGNRLMPDQFSAYAFVALLTFAAVIILSVITTLSRFWYFVGAGLFILFIASLRFEILELFGRTDKIFTIGVLLIYVPVTYYFNAIRSETSFAARLLTFAVLTFVLAIVITLFAAVPKPFLHLSVTGITAAIVLTAIFIITVAHEILAAFIFIVSSGNKQSKSLNHFLIITVIYFVNLVLAYANKFHFIDWDFLYINFFLLLTISGVLGVWGFRQRQPQWEGILDVEALGTYFFMCMGAVAFGTIGYFMANANDPGIEAINDIIIFAHLGYGIIFITYVIANFFDLLGNNLPAFRVLYKPARMPYFTFRFGGLIATLAFIFYNAWQVPAHSAFAAYYNAGGDLYQTLGNVKLAHGFYDQGATYAFLNHHSNYAIADIEANRLSYSKEREFYKRASDLRPTDMSVLNYAETFFRERNWLEAMLALRDGAKQIPDNGPIQNTQGLVYAKLNLLDSALFLFQHVPSSSSANTAAKTNIIALAAQHQFSVSPDSLYNMLGSSQAGVKANALAFANQKGERIKMEIDIDKDTVLNLFSATLLSNYLLNHLGELDSAFITKAIRLGERRVNSDFSEALLFASSLALYEDDQVGRAFQQLEKVTVYSNDNQGKYNNILALWALEQNAPKVAIPYLNYSVNQSYEPAIQTSAIAAAEAGSISPAIILWDSLKRTKDSLKVAMSETMIRVLAGDPKLVSKLNDADKYAYCRYRIQPHDSTQLLSIVNLIQDEEYKARAILDHCKNLYALDETDAAISMFQKLKNLKLRDRRVYHNLIRLELLMLAAKGQWDVLTEQLKQADKNILSKPESVYLSTLLSYASGDTTSLAKNFTWLASVNPFFEDAVITTASYFKATSTKKFKAYEILTDAMYRHPHSVKYLKAYCLEAARVGFDEFSANALVRLQREISVKAYNQFVSANKDVLFAKTD